MLLHQGADELKQTSILCCQRGTGDGASHKRGRGGTLCARVKVEQFLIWES